VEDDEFEVDVDDDEFDESRQVWVVEFGSIIVICLVESKLTSGMGWVWEMGGGWVWEGGSWAIGTLSVLDLEILPLGLTTLVSPS
jgi:hypothetical protein